MLDNTVKLIDFDNSYLTWRTLDNSFGRFKIEAVCELEYKNKVVNQFFLVSSVMACNVYGKGKLFHNPHYSFTAIFSSKQYKRIRAFKETKSIDYGEHKSVFRCVKLEIINSSYTRVLPDTINSTLVHYSRLVSRVSFSTINKDIKVNLTFPVKHINYKTSPTFKFQIETGPVLIPSRLFNRTNGIKEICLAYIAINDSTTLHIWDVLSEKENEIVMNRFNLLARNND